MKALAGLTAALLLVGCGAASSPTSQPTPTATASPTLPTQTPAPTPTTIPSSSPSPTPIRTIGVPTQTPSPAGALSPAEVRYLLIDRLGPLHFCDPDEYPVAHGDEQQKAIAQFPTIQADAPTFAAISQRTGLAGKSAFTDADKLQIYREWKVLNGVDAEPSGNDQYQFDVTTEGDAASGQATHYEGTVDAQTGEISIATQEQVFGVACPICLARGTLIDTPNGPLAVDLLQPGEPIWTTDSSGKRVASLVARVGSVPVPSTHQVVRLVLDDGRTVEVSPGHPLVDARRVGELAPGDRYDGATVVSSERISYAGGRTFDVLPAGETGFYWANGVLLASTLK